MDMGFHVVYSLGSVLYADGYPGVLGFTAGYALNHRWL